MLANHGTLFLDEIGDMPIEMQAITSLQEQTVDFGSSKSVPVDEWWPQRIAIWISTSIEATFVRTCFID